MRKTFLSTIISITFGLAVTSAFADNPADKPFSPDEVVANDLKISQNDLKIQEEIADPFKAMLKSRLTQEEYEYINKKELDENNLTDKDVELFNKALGVPLTKQQYLDAIKAGLAEQKREEQSLMFAEINYPISSDVYRSYVKHTDFQNEQATENVEVKVDKPTQNINTPNNINPRNLNSNLYFASLPFEYAIKTVYGTGEKILAEFVDVECPYCANQSAVFEQNKDLVNTTVYQFLVNNSDRKETKEKNNYFWCADNREALLKSWQIYWNQAVQSGTDVDSAFLAWKLKEGVKNVDKCNDPTEYNRVWMNGFNGKATPLNITPTLSIINQAINFHETSFIEYERYFKPILSEKQLAELDYSPLEKEFGINVKEMQTFYDEAKKSITIEKK